MPNRLRKVLASDRDDIISIVEACTNLSAEDSDCAVEILDIYLNDGAQDDYLFIAATGEDDTPVGYVCYGSAALTEGVFDIYWILVEPGSRGLGVGRTLLQHTGKLVREMGARMMIAETSSLDSYRAARDFYIKSGFSEESRVRGYYRDGDDKITYVKRF